MISRQMGVGHQANLAKRAWDRYTGVHEMLQRMLRRRYRSAAEAMNTVAWEPGIRMNCTDVGARRRARHYPALSRGARTLLDRRRLRARPDSRYCLRACMSHDRGTRRSDVYCPPPPQSRVTLSPSVLALPLQPGDCVPTPACGSFETADGAPVSAPRLRIPPLAAVPRATDWSCNPRRQRRHAR